MSQTTNEVINPLNQYTMEKDRYMLIHLDRDIYRFKSQMLAESYGERRCRGPYEYYVIVDTEKDEVVYRWNY